LNLYRVSGLSVASTLVLPGLIAAEPVRGCPDVIIRNEPVPLTLEHHDASGPTWAVAGDRFLLRIPDIARFLLTGGREIAFETESGTSPDDVAIFLVGTVFGILLHQREHIVLHASAVRVGDKAVLFCGPSGAGKSTLAAALSRRGFSFVTDDVCAILLDAGKVPMVQPDGRQLKLWDHAIENLDLTASRGAPVRQALQKFYVEPDEALGAPLPLGAVYMLREARPPHKPGIERPNVVDSTLLLRNSAYRPSVVNRLGQKANYFRAATAMADAAGIFHLTRALDFSLMPQVVSQLERHWEELGLSEKIPA